MSGLECFYVSLCWFIFFYFLCWGGEKKTSLNGNGEHPYVVRIFIWGCIIDSLFTHSMNQCIRLDNEKLMLLWFSTRHLHNKIPHTFYGSPDRSVLYFGCSLKFVLAKGKMQNTWHNKTMGKKWKLANKTEENVLLHPTTDTETLTVGMCSTGGIFSSAHRR